VINVAVKTPPKIRLGTCIYEMSLLHRPDDYIGFTASCPRHMLQQILRPWPPRYLFVNE